MWKTKNNCGKYWFECGKPCGKKKKRVEKEDAENLKLKTYQLIRT
jgi:hypothetical protein